MNRTFPLMGVIMSVFNNVHCVRAAVESSLTQIYAEHIARMDLDGVFLPERLMQTPHAGVAGTQMNIMIMKTKPGIS